MNYAIICALGRSGSTLLQGVLNTSNNCCIRGENQALMLHLYKGFRALRASKISSHQEKTDPQNPFYGSEYFNAENYIKKCREIVTDQLCAPYEADVLGFKEVGWSEDTLQGINMWNYIRFINKVLINPKFVLLTRDTGEMISSGWWKDNDPDEVIDVVNTFYLIFRNSNCNYFEIDYRSICNLTKEVEHMFEFLGINYDEHRIKRVLKIKHSF